MEQSLFKRESFVSTPEGLELHLFVRELFAEEFAGEFKDANDPESTQLIESVQDYLRQRHPDKQISKVKIFLGSLLLANFALLSSGGEGVFTVKQALASSHVGIFVNGIAQPALKTAAREGVTVVSAKALAGALGATYKYDPNSKKISINRNGIELVMQVGSKTATLNNRTIDTGVSPVWIGEEIYVPVRTVSESLLAKVCWDSNRQVVLISTQPSVVYTVQKGDTLWGISKKYQTTVQEVQRLNGMKDTGSLVPSQQILIPVKSVAYVVKAGDSLYSIAKKYNTTVDSVKTVNGLKSDDIYTGQTLQIPQIELQESSDDQAMEPADNFLEKAVAEDPVAASQLGKPHFVFPFQPTSTYTPYTDTWGESREYNPNGTTRQHEGTDILAPRGTPVVAVGDGVISSFGWNQLGGWRVTIKLDNTNYAAYYAHLSKYPPGLGKGVRVKAGQIVGYVGDSGYGPEGTTGKFVNHLHFGLYNTKGEWKATNSYFLLKYWEANQY